MFNVNEELLQYQRLYSRTNILSKSVNRTTPDHISVMYQKLLQLQLHNYMSHQQFGFSNANYPSRHTIIPKIPAKISYHYFTWNKQLLVHEKENNYKTNKTTS